MTTADPPSPDLDALEQALAGMTPLLRYEMDLTYIGSGDYTAAMSEDPCGDWLLHCPEIVASVNALPGLIAEVRRLRAALAAGPTYPVCQCTHEPGDSRCDVHPTCENCGDPLPDRDRGMGALLFVPGRGTGRYCTTQCRNDGDGAPARTDEAT